MRMIAVAGTVLLGAAEPVAVGPVTTAGATTQRVSVSSAGPQANGETFGATISADGRYVAFESARSNLLPGDTNGVNGVFVRDRVG
jgi:hypothetical protein